MKGIESGAIDNSLLYLLSMGRGIGDAWLPSIGSNKIILFLILIKNAECPSQAIWYSLSSRLLKKELSIFSVSSFSGSRRESLLKKSHIEMSPVERGVSSALINLPFS